MQKVGWVTVTIFLFFLLAASHSFAQMEMGKSCHPGMAGEEMMSPPKCMPQCMSGQEGMRQKTGGCMMGEQMGMKMCGMKGEEEKMGCCKMGFFLCCKDKLELTDKQIETLKSIKIDFMKNKFKMEADLRIADLELQSLMQDDKATLKEIETKLRTVEKLKTDMKLSHLQALKKAKEILTEEQKEKTKECHKM
jgi:hypothetical protein